MVLKCEFWKKKKVHFCKYGYRVLFYPNQGKMKKNIIKVKLSFNSQTLLATQALKYK